MPETREKRINENKLAVAVLKMNQGKESCSLGQTKEVIDNLLDHLAESYQPSQVLELIEKHY